ncbi:MAG: response regulator [Desulfovibrio sp.]|jgi:two-component system chemotaxis response regulator CheY|nr:response regulator [Desulfovibrio sp.]
MRFLVVDDDFETRRLVQKLLRPFGEVDVATDGEEAVEAFARSLKESEPYALVTMDILMPNVDGQQALREIREIEKDHGVADADQVKVIMISGLDNSEELHDAFFLGDATGYIVKPINHEALLQEIAKLGVPLPQKS